MNEFGEPIIIKPCGVHEFLTTIQFGRPCLRREEARSRGREMAPGAIFQAALWSFSIRLEEKTSIVPWTGFLTTHGILTLPTSGHSILPEW